jgi:hypothetical protein
LLLVPNQASFMLGLGKIRKKDSKTPGDLGIM